MTVSIWKLLYVYTFIDDSADSFEPVKIKRKSKKKKNSSDAPAHKKRKKDEDLGKEEVECNLYHELCIMLQLFWYK